MKFKSSILLGGSLLFLIAGLITSHYLQLPFAPQSRADKLAASLSEELSAIDHDASLLVTQFQQNASRDIAGTAYAFFVFNNQRVISWSDNGFVPSVASVADTFKLKLLKAGNGDYLAKKWQISQTQYLVAVIPTVSKI